MLNNKVYDILKWIVIIVIPASITLFETIAALLGMEFQLMAVITGIAGAIDTFLGTLLGISSVKYNKEIGYEGKDN